VFAPDAAQVLLTARRENPAQAICLNNLALSSKTIVLGGYFDESGIHDEGKILVMCGYIGPSDEWGRVERVWREEFGNIVFHAADLESGFGDFKGTGPRERDRIKSRAIEIVTHSALLGIASGVVKEHYLQVFNTPELQAVSGSPYEACFQDAIDRALDRSAMFVTEDRHTAFVFDQQEEWQRKGKMMWDGMMQLSLDEWDFREFAESLTFGSKKKLVPLQIADHLAYETYKYLHNKHYDPNRRRRIAMNRLLSWPQNYGRYIDLRGARELYEHLKASGRIKTKGPR
jgi:hypothetical protein